MPPRDDVIRELAADEVPGMTAEMPEAGGLTPFAAQFRYPGSPPLGRASAQTALALAERVAKIVQQSLGRLGLTDAWEPSP